jgi:hypothetical protein
MISGEDRAAVGMRLGQNCLFSKQVLIKEKNNNKKFAQFLTFFSNKTTSFNRVTKFTLIASAKF